MTLTFVVERKALGCEVSWSVYETAE